MQHQLWMIIDSCTPPAGRNKQQATWILGTQQNQDNAIYNNIDIKIKPCSDSKVAADLALQTPAEEPWSTPLTQKCSPECR